jgi:acetyl esterase/lipase
MRIAWVIAILASTSAGQPAAAPPPQPDAGPGGKSYAHAAVKSFVYETGAEQYWIFQPDQPRPAAEALAPVVVFLHGWNATHPRIYGAWIEHIVRRGNTVIFPRYQKDWSTPPSRFTPNTLTAVQRAWNKLHQDGHVKPDRARFAIVGHSVGGLLTANLAGLAESNGLPAPRAIMPVQPGISSTGVREWPGVKLESLHTIPRSTQMIVLVGDMDRLVGRNDGDRIHRFTPLPPERKHYFLMRSDQHGLPGLLADHVSPIAYGDLGLSAELLKPPDEPGPPAGIGGGAGAGFRNALLGAAGKLSVNALDYQGYWRLFDELTDAAFADRLWKPNPAMGEWSDGKPIAPLQSLARP